MSLLMKMRGWVLGLVVVLTAGAAAPVVGQQVTFAEGDVNGGVRREPWSKTLDFGQSFPAGWYSVEYVSGAMRYFDNRFGPPESDREFNLFDTGDDTGWNYENWSITHSGGQKLRAPGGHKDYGTAGAVASDNAGKKVRFYHAGGAISMTFSDNSGGNNGKDYVAFIWELSEDDCMQLQVGDSDSGASQQGNADYGEKQGYPLQEDSFTQVQAIVPDGYTNADAELSFDLPPSGLTVYKSDKTTEVTSPYRWPIGGSSNNQTFYIKADGPCDSMTLTLQAVNYNNTSSDSSSSGETDKADADDGGATGVTICKDQVTVSCGGCGCEASCVGESGGTNGCLEFQIGLGLAGFGEEAGSLILFAKRPGPGLSTPDMLQLFLNDRLQAVKGPGNAGARFTESGDILTHSGSEDSIWGEAELTVDSAYKYHIDFYEKDGNGTKAASPYRTVTIENLNGATSSNELYITEQIELAGSTPRTRMWHYKWQDSTGTEAEGWVLTEGQAGGAAGLAGDTILRVTERSEVWNDEGDQVVETVTVKEEDGTVVSVTEEVWQVFDWGREKVSMTLAPGTANELKEIWAFYDVPSDVDNYGRLKGFLSETGYWEGYAYNADGDTVKTIRQLNDNAFDLGVAFATAEAANIVEEYAEYSETIAGYTQPVDIEKWQIRVAGVVERTWYKVYVAQADSGVSGSTLELMVRPVVKDPENGTTLAAVIKDVLDGTDTTSLITKSWHWEAGASGIGGNEPYDVRAMQSPDGQYTVYERSISGGQRSTVMKRGFSDASLVNILSGAGDIEYGTRTTSVTDARGNMVSTLTEMVSESDNGGAWFVESLMKVGASDEFGRPTQTDYYFGEEAQKEAATTGSGSRTYFTEMAYGCCGGGEQETRTSRAGVINETFFDVLGRTEKSVQASGTSGEIESLMVYDAAGRVMARGINGNPDADDDLDDATDLKSSSTYDLAGRMISTTDPEGRKRYMTYRRVTTSGGNYTGTGVFYWETRWYGHDDSAPVSVTWTDSHGRTVLNYTGSGTWSGTPSGAEVLIEHTRGTSVYDWEDRMVEGRAYFNLGSLAKNASGSAGTNYLVTGTTEYDALGRGFRRIDAVGNITETVYEAGTGRAIATKIGVDPANLHTVSRMYYKTFVGGAPTGDDRPWATRSYTVKPGLTTAPDDSDLNDASPTFTDYTYNETVESYGVTGNAMTYRRMESRPEYGPWSKQETDVEGRPKLSVTYKNGDPNYALTRSLNDYDSLGRLYRTRQKPNNGSGGTVNASIVTSQTYFDDASRPIKSETPGRGFTKTEYDVYGRTKRTVFGSSEGSDTSTYGANQFTGDIILTESVPTYDKSGLVTGTVTYERAHDAPGSNTGLLSNAAADQSRSSYSYTWYDANGRQTHSATSGTSAYSYNAASPPMPNSTDSLLITKVEYDAAGRRYLTTDNLGRQNRTFYDDLNRVTYSVENWDGVLTDPANPGSREEDVNRVTQTIYDNGSSGGGARIASVAIDPDGDGSTADNQSTLYLHSGELSVAAKKGPIPVNGRPIAVVMPDALEDPTSGGETRTGALAKIDSGTAADPSGGGDFALTEYYANGQVLRTTDARGVQMNSFYTPEGWMDYTTVTEATTNSWDAVGNRRTAYSYGDAGEVLTITTFDNVAGTSGGETSKVSYTYDGFYNRLTEGQDHDPTAGSGTGVPKTLSWAFDQTLDGSNIYTNAHRLDKITYPSGRVLQMQYDGHGGIDHAISRANAIEEDSSGGDIVSYEYLGSGRMVRKNYPIFGAFTGGLRLDMVDEAGEGTDADDDYEASLDRFGRPTRYQWETYNYYPGNGTGDLIHITHGYDRNSNRLYDERPAPGNTTGGSGQSRLYHRDELDRITQLERGILVDNGGTKQIDWKRLSETKHLDALGNPTQVDRETKTPYTQNITHNDANELESREVYERARVAKVADGFGSDSTESDWSSPGSETFNITGGFLQPSAITADTINGQTEQTAHGVFLWGPELGTVHGRIGLQFNAANTTTTVRAGMVFGYQDAHNYWIATMRYVPGGQSQVEICQVTNGALTVVASQNHTITAGANIYTPVASTANMIQNFGLYRSFPDGVPSGRIGLYTDSASVKFNYLEVYPHDESSDLAGRWDRHSLHTSDVGSIRVANSGDGRHYPTFLRGVTTPASQPWRTTFMMNRGNASRNHDGLRFLFNVRDRDTYSSLTIRHAATTQSIGGDEFVGGHSSSVVGEPAQPSGNFATAANQNDKLWVRVESDGSAVSVKMVVDNTGAPSESTWTNTGVAFISTGFNLTGGQIGVRAVYGTAYLKHVKVETDADNNGDFVTEYEDDISAWSEYQQITHEYDAAGNMTYDGEKAYTYDAYNRLVAVHNAYRDPSGGGAIQTGSPIAEYAYDSGGRRIEEKVYLGGVLDKYFHHYYSGWSLIETRDNHANGQRLLSQYVWDNAAPGSGHYIDSLAQIGHNVNLSSFTPGVGDETADRFFYPMQDQQFNVLGLVDEQGVLVERYEYSLYGERQVYRRSNYDIGYTMLGDFDRDGDVDSDDNTIFFANYNQSGKTHADGDVTGDGVVDGTDYHGVFRGFTMNPRTNDIDPQSLTPTMGSAWIESSGAALNPFGFQGLYHDAGTGLIQNRHRVLDPKTGRFMQRDPLGYPDGMNTYAAYHVLRGGVDPSGMRLIAQNCIDEYLDKKGISYEVEQVGKRWVYTGPEEKGEWSDLEGEILTKLIQARFTYRLDDKMEDLDSSIEALEKQIRARISIIEFANKKQYGFGAGVNGVTLNDEFWSFDPKGTTDISGLKVNRDVSPTDALNDLNQNHGLYNLPCNQATACTLLGGIANSMGKEAFDDIAGERGLRRKLLLYKKGFRENEWVPGDAGWIQNTGEGEKGLGLEGENIIYMGNDKFWGHFGTEVANKSLEEWKDIVASWNGSSKVDGHREFPKAGLSNR